MGYPPLLPNKGPKPDNRPNIGLRGLGLGIRQATPIRCALATEHLMREHALLFSTQENTSLASGLRKFPISALANSNAAEALAGGGRRFDDGDDDPDEHRDEDSHSHQDKDHNDHPHGGHFSAYYGRVCYS